MAWPKGKPRDPEALRKAAETRKRRARRAPDVVRFSIDDGGALTITQGSKLFWPLSAEDTERLRTFLFRTAPPLNAQRGETLPALAAEEEK